MKKFNVTYSYATTASNSFGEVSPMRYGRTITVKGENSQQVESEIRKSLENEIDVKVSVCER